MAIVISGVNNNDKITASDGTIDLLSGVNYAGIITAPAFTTPGNITAGHLNIGSGIQLGNAGVATATTFVGNLTGNVNATSNLLLQIGGSEKFRVASSGQLGIGGANYGTSGQVLTSGGSGSAATWSTVDLSAVTGATGDFSIADKIVHTGDTNTAIRFPAVDTITAETSGLERLRIDSSGNLLIGDSAGQIGKLSTLGTGNHISAIRHSTDASSANFLFAKYRGSRSSPTVVADGDMLGDLAWYGYNGSSIIKAASVSASASSTVDGSNMPTDLIFKTTYGNTNTERLRITSDGTITNSTNSTHSQGAGTFNIKGIINQYSQGSGSGLIFDCDFGRLTAYSDNGGISNSTNLSAALAHSTTDWTSSSSNTPMTVNGGSFNYRVGRGGYLDCVQNEGRISIGAGSGAPAIADKLNTASMTIESWIWYDGAGREVIVSRFGSGFPNQFNMLCDPDGQFHYNNSGVGAGSGNITGQNFPDKTWHHHVWQYDSGNNVNRWYINGAFASSASAGSSLAVSSATGFAIASRADDMERWDGKIAVVRIYNRALSAAEIKNHFELDRGRFGV